MAQPGREEGEADTGRSRGARGQGGAAPQPRPVLLRLPISHYCHKVEWALADLGVTVDACNLWFRDLVDIRDINPENTVPVLELEDGLVCGSHAILEWVSHQAGVDLWPHDEVADWEAWADETIGPLARRDTYRTLYERPWQYSANPLLWGVGVAARGLVLNVLKSVKARRFYEQDDEQRDAVLARVGARLHETPFLFGESKTAADYATAALLRPMMRIRGASHTRHPDRKRLRAYVRRVRPGASPFARRMRFTPAIRQRMASKRD